VHLVGFTIEIYHDARSYKRQILERLQSRTSTKNNQYQLAYFPTTPDFSIQKDDDNNNNNNNNNI
jgi:hypothetical protein